METLEQFILNHWVLWLALAVVLIVIFINEVLMQQKRAKELTPTQAVNAINHDDAVVFDLRDKEAFRAGHIIDSIRVDVDELSQKRMEKYKTKPVILVCARGVQAASVASKLKEQGFENTMVLSGGMSAWVSANLPVDKGKS